jgi:FkbM family methyltransferase
MSYALGVFRTKSFRQEPAATIYRAASWVLFHVLPKRRAVVTIPVGNTNFKLDLPPILRHAGSTGIYVERRYYEPLLEFCHSLIREGDTVFDCGANIGIYSCAFGALVGKSGRVISFEPQDYAVTALLNNTRLNGFNHVSVEQVCVSDRQGTAILDTSQGEVQASIVRDFGRERAESVSTATLTTVAERLRISRLDLIKMDIEGAELPALIGGAELLRQHRPILVMESTPPQFAELVGFLTAYGYKPYMFDTDGHLYAIDRVTERAPGVVFLPDETTSAGRRPLVTANAA